MTEYAKLKVAELKAELKERGLQVSGLKADLVARLEEADTKQDAANDAGRRAEEDDAPTGAAETQPTAVSGKEAGASTQAAEHPPNNGGSGAMTLIPLETAIPVTEAIPEPIAASQPDATALDAAAPLTTSNEPVSELGASTEPPSVPTDNTNSQTMADIALPHVDTAMISPDETVDAALESQAADTAMQTTTGATREDVATLDEHISPVAAIDMRTDQMQRRKRSHTPDPHEREVHKKLKTAVEAVGEVQAPLPALTDAIAGESAEVEKHAPEPKETLSVDEAIDDVDDDPMRKRNILTTHASTDTGALETEVMKDNEANDEATLKRSKMQDTRFNHLVEPKVGSGASERRRSGLPDQKAVAPSIHPATSTLYIRNLKRPLHPGQLQSHLATLAGEEGEDTKVTAFFLDSIKTHCFVRYSSIAAASRVRAALHDRVWPEERTRDPLWVDYVPQHKLDRWIEVEQAEGGKRGHGAGQKRWEVVYEEQDGQMTAFLQEEASQQAPNKNGRDMNSRPAEFQRRETEGSRRPQVKSDPGRGFKTLDDLFKSTTAKPKLYFLPVKEELARRRLERLDEGKGGGRGNGTARYTFEDEDFLVDAGPDRGLRLDRSRAFVGGGGRGSAFRGRGGYR